MKRYSILLLDPPWQYDDTLPGPGRGAEKHYTVLTDDVLKSLPVLTRAADDCALFLWATGAKLDVAIDCLRAWDFEFVTVAFVWVKLTSAGEALLDLHRLVRSTSCASVLDNANLVPLLRAIASAEPDAFGMGRMTRSNEEYVLLGRRGRPQRIDAAVRQTVFARPLAHSKKPPEVRERIVRLLGDVPRLELFARDCGEGWDATGLEYDGLDVMEALVPRPVELAS